MSARPRPRRDDRGAVTVLAVAFLGLVLLVGAALGVAAAMVVDHRRAQAAADLAALAGAVAHQRGEDGCAAAARVASANSGVLTECTVEGDDVGVEVRVTGPRWLGQVNDLAGRARAGPG
jgi:secretion/DNA translocation related TadE-like protein